MTIAFSIVAAAIAVPILIVASYPIHATLALRRSRRYHRGKRFAHMSVIVPVRGLDEERTHALRQITAQRTGGSIDLLFCVEDESDPATPELDALAATDPDRIRVLVTGPCGDRLGKMHNLIEGVAATHGEWLVFVDSDTILPHSSYLEEFAAPLQDHEVGLVTCFPAYLNAASVPAAMLAGSINHDLLGHFALQSVWGGLRLANGSCMAMRRDVLDSIGGFEPQSAALLMDVILANRVRDAGYEVLMHHEPVVVPCRTVTAATWWNQSHRWQVGMSHVLSGPFYSWYCWMRSVFPVSLAMMLLASSPFAILGAIAVATRLSVMVIMSQVFVRDRRQLRYLWLLPLLEIITAAGCWYALFQNQVEWRGRNYRVLAGGLARRLA